MQLTSFLTYIFILLAVTLHTVTFFVSYYLSEDVCCCFVIAIAIIITVIIICILYEDQGGKVMAIEKKN